MKRLRLLLLDFKYFFLIMLLILMIAIFWIPLKILEIFFKDKFTRSFANFFMRFD